MLHHCLGPDRNRSNREALLAPQEIPSGSSRAKSLAKSNDRRAELRTWLAARWKRWSDTSCILCLRRSRLFDIRFDSVTENQRSTNSRNISRHGPMVRRNSKTALYHGLHPSRFHMFHPYGYPHHRLIGVATVTMKYLILRQKLFN
jgi:hypothetical protein